MPSSARPAPSPTLWRDPDLRRLWAGQTASQLGEHASLTILPLIAVLTLGVGAEQLGLLRAAGQAPLLLLTLVAGVWVDRHRTRTTMIVADLGRAAALAGVAVLALLSSLTLPALLAVTVAVGAFSALFDVAYQAALVRLVHRTHLLRATSALEASRSAAQLAGPALAGTLITLLTAPVAAASSALAFAMSCVALARIRHREPLPPASSPVPSPPVTVPPPVSSPPVSSPPASSAPVSSPRVAVPPPVLSPPTSSPRAAVPPPVSSPRVAVPPPVSSPVPVPAVSPPSGPSAVPSPVPSPVPSAVPSAAAPPGSPPQRLSQPGRLAEGVRFVAAHPLLRAVCLASAAFQLSFSALMTAYLLFLPRDLHLSATAIGLTLAATGPGALLGSLLATRLPPRLGYGPVLVTAALIGDGAMLFLPALDGGSNSTTAALIAVNLLFGALGQLVNVTLLTVRQTVTPDALQGRVAATITFAGMGLTPFGSLLGGHLASTHGLRTALLITATAMLLSPLLMALSPLARLGRTLPSPPTSYAPAPASPRRPDPPNPAPKQ